MKRIVTALVVALTAACSGNVASRPPSVDGGADLQAADTAAADSGSGPCPQNPCLADQLCLEGHCVADRGPCSDDDDCLADSYCHEGRCVPYGAQTKTHDPACINVGFTPEAFEPPVIKCQWNRTSVINTPVVADLIGDATPEIAFTDDLGQLVVIDGATCNELYAVDVGFHHYCHLAVADLTGDGVPEIVGVDGANKVIVVSNEGVKLATAAEGAVGNVKGNGPAIVNVDGQGPPEIIYAGQGLRFENGALTQLYNVAVPVGGPYGIAIAAVADLDLDGTAELFTGNRILDALTGADETPASVAELRAGYAAVAQFDSTTPEPEVVLVSSSNGVPSEIRIYHPVSGAVVFGPYTFDQSSGGPPTVADFDGDGQPEVGVAGYSGYWVFDRECAATPLPAFCAQPGTRWFKQTQDFTSATTGSSVFDFNGDGRAEVVYRDECWLRIYDGRDGQVRSAFTVTSGTTTEYPVIADTDGDGHADVVVASNTYDPGCAAEADLGLPPAGTTLGVFVLTDAKNRWMPSRAIWNQHTYHITNVGDDATVPLAEQPNWDSWNNFRQNAQGMLEEEIPAPDLTGKKHVGIDPDSDCDAVWVLLAELCNRGATAAPAGTAGTFYEGDPRGGSATAICTAATTEALAPGECALVKCSWADPPPGAVDLWFAADDDGSGSVEIECNEENNLLHLPQTKCPGIDIE